jgi:ABC-type bacteriocin/lantibiotic exporter with double-glycine peptidase domain
MLFKIIGFSAFASVGAMLCLGPYQSVIFRLFTKYQNEILLAADDRLSLTTEVFQAIKVLKFFAWERRFAEKLAEKRMTELHALRKRAGVFALGGVAFCTFPSNFAVCRGMSTG